MPTNTENDHWFFWSKCSHRSRIVGKGELHGWKDDGNHALDKAKIIGFGWKPFSVYMLLNTLMDAFRVHACGFDLYVQYVLTRETFICASFRNYIQSFCLFSRMTSFLLEIWRCARICMIFSCNIDQRNFSQLQTINIDLSVCHKLNHTWRTQNWMGAAFLLYEMITFQEVDQWSLILSMVCCHLQMADHWLIRYRFQLHPLYTYAPFWHIVTIISVCFKCKHQFIVNANQFCKIYHLYSEYRNSQAFHVAK